MRLEKDVTLCLHEGKDNSLARTERDDARDAHLTLDDLIPSQGSTPLLSFDNLSILLGKFSFDSGWTYEIYNEIVTGLVEIRTQEKRKLSLDT